MKKIYLTLSILLLSVSCIYANAPLGSGLPGYSSSPLGSSGYNNPNIYRNPVYDNNTPQARPSFDTTPSQSIPYSVYRDNASLSPAEQYQRNSELKKIYKKY